MDLPPVVSNASPLIALQQIGHLDLLEELFHVVVVPAAVAREIAPTVTLPDSIEVVPLREEIGTRILRATLGPGESETLSLALELQSRLAILDERPARRLAHSLDLPVIGTLGILTAAKRKGLLKALKPNLDALVGHGFRISPFLYEAALSDAGESP